MLISGLVLSTVESYPTVSTLTLLGCYQVLIRGQVRHLKGFIHPVITCETAVNIGILNGSQRRIGRSDRPLVAATESVCASAHTCAAERRLMLTGVHRWLWCSHLISQ